MPGRKRTPDTTAATPPVHADQDGAPDAPQSAAQDPATENGKKRKLAAYYTNAGAAD